MERREINQLTDYLKLKNFTPKSFMEIGSFNGHDTELIQKYWDIDPSNCYIIEADPNCYPNIVMDYPQYNVFHFAASNKDGFVEFNSCENQVLSSTLQHHDPNLKSEKVTVPSKRLDTFLNELNLNNIDLIKIDVEGFGAQVLEGFGDSIRNIKVIQIELEKIRNWYDQTLYNDVVKYLELKGFLIENFAPAFERQLDVLFLNKEFYPSNVEIGTYSDLKNYKDISNTIPKIIFRTGNEELDYLPDCVLELYNKTIKLNPGYRFFYFSDSDCETFIKDEWGDGYISLYNKLVPTAYKADFFRYLLLYNYGGCYGDFTQEMLISYNELNACVDRVFCRDTFSMKHGLYNAIMCVKPKDIVIEKAIELCVNNIKNETYGETSLDITGPGVLGFAYQHFNFDGRTFPLPIQTGTQGTNKILDNPGTKNEIVDDDIEKIVCLKKIPEHHGLLYNSVNKHYQEYWNDRNVFKKDLVI